MLKKVFVDIDKKTRNVLGYGSSPISDNCTEIELPVNDPFFTNPSSYRLSEDLNLERENGIELSRAKKRKAEELNKKCEEAILFGFELGLDGVEYHFSYDLEAQSNFQANSTLLLGGHVDSVKWTVKQNGEYRRIDINKDKMLQLMVAATKHKESCISHYREKLLPQLEKADSIEAVNAVTW